MCPGICPWTKSGQSAFCDNGVGTRRPSVRRKEIPEKAAAVLLLLLLAECLCQPPQAVFRLVRLLPTAAAATAAATQEQEVQPLRGGGLALREALLT